MQAAISAGQVLLPHHGVYVRSASHGIYFHIMLKPAVVGQSPLVDCISTLDSTTAPSHHADPAGDDSGLPHSSAAASEPSVPCPSTVPTPTAEAQSPNNTPTLRAAQNPDTVSRHAAPLRKHARKQTRWISTETKRNEAAPPLHNFLLQLLEGADNTYANVKVRMADYVTTLLLTRQLCQLELSSAVCIAARAYQSVLASDFRIGQATGVWEWVFGASESQDTSVTPW